MKIDRLINQFRAEEKLLDCAAVLEDRDIEAMAFKVLRAWQTFPRPEFEELADDVPLPSDAVALWEILWFGFDPTQAIRILAERTGLTQSQTAKIFAIVRANRLIYPDHTIHGSMAAILDLAARRLYESKMSPDGRARRRRTNGVKQSKPGVGRRGQRAT